MDITELTEQLNALQVKVDELNARIESMSAHRPPAPRSWLGRRLRPVAWQAGILGIFLVTAVAQTKDPITVGPDGNVRIGTSLQVNSSVSAANYTGDGSALQVGQDSIKAALDKKIGFGPNNSIEARNYINFNFADHAGFDGNKFEGNAVIENGKAYHALMLLGRYESGWGNRRLVRVWDTLGIGEGRDTNFEGRIDAKGEIRGRLWTSGGYQWEQGKPPIKMSKADHASCFLTAVRGSFKGAGELVRVYLGNDGYWYLGGSSGQNDVLGQAICIGAPDDSW